MFFYNYFSGLETTKNYDRTKTDTGGLVEYTKASE